MPSCIRRTNRLPFLAAPWLCFHRTFSTITKNQIFKYLVTGTAKETLQYYENITHDFRYDSLTLTPCIC